MGSPLLERSRELGEGSCGPWPLRRHAGSCRPLSVLLTRLRPSWVDGGRRASGPPRGLARRRRCGPAGAAPWTPWALPGPAPADRGTRRGVPADGAGLRRSFPKLSASLEQGRPHADREQQRRVPALLRSTPTCHTVTNRTSTDFGEALELRVLTVPGAAEE
jgi:hypothetical protein